MPLANPSTATSAVVAARRAAFASRSRASRAASMFASATSERVGFVSRAQRRKLARMRPFVHRLLRVRMWIVERFRPGESLWTLVWAAAIGCLGGLGCGLMRSITDEVAWLFTQSHKELIDAANDLVWWKRLIMPAIGGCIAGFILQLGVRWSRARSIDYMEAVTIGDGVIRSRPTMFKIASSIFSFASGGSIGREGPMVQLAAMLASLTGRWAKLPTPRLRLIVACGAAAGIASAYNAPIGGALFVAEIVLGSIAMESFGPLVLSSVIATVVSRSLRGGAPLFEVETFHLVSAIELIPYLFLGCLAGAAAPLFMLMLDHATRMFERGGWPLPVRLAVGGLIVGALSIVHPDVWGNGYGALTQIVEKDWVWTALLSLLVFKLVATASTVGSGAVGGVFTPTLLVGAVIGGLVGNPVHHQLPTLTAPPHAYALVGMGAFLAATTHAPLMAILILFDMTLNHEIVLPLMVSCVSAYTIATVIRRDSIYSIPRKAREPEPPTVSFANMRVKDLMRPDPPHVVDSARFSEVVQVFARNRHHNLYVVSAGGRFRGVIPMHEIRPFLNNEELGNIAIAEDLVHEEFPTVTPEMSLGETLEKFTHHDGERLPVIAGEGRELLGSVSKTDLLLTLAHGAKTDGKA
jgi:CIC family chloride channel protein